MFKKFQKGGKFAYELLVPTVKKNLTERRKHFEDLVKGADKYTKNLTNEGKIKVKETIQPAAKKISKIMDKKDKIENKAKGGRVGLKFGSKKSNVQKIKETFGPKKQLSAKQMKIAKLAGNPKKIDAQDLAKLRGRG
jgi:predicted DNA binding protein